MSVKGQLGNFQPEGDKGLDDNVYQNDLKSFFYDIRKVKIDMEKNRVEVEDNIYKGDVTRGSLGGISVMATIFLILWKFIGKIKHLQAIRQPQTNFSLPIADVHKQPHTNFPLPIAHVHQQPQPAYAPTVGGWEKERQ